MSDYSTLNKNLSRPQPMRGPRNPLSEYKDMARTLGDTKDIYDNWGIEGLLGQYFASKLGTNKWNLDLPNSQLNWLVNDKLNMYLRPDSLANNKPKGLRFGLNYRF